MVTFAAGKRVQDVPGMEQVSGRNQTMRISREKRAVLMKSASYASVATALCLIVLKFWAWQRTDSIALLSSLADSFLDLLASLLIVFAVHYALTPADKEHRFGHGKSEGIAGLAQSALVAGSAIYVAVKAILRLIVIKPVNEPGTGLLVIGISMVMTGALVLFQRYVRDNTGSVAIAADAMHYKSDFVLNAGVILAVVLTAYAGWWFADSVFGLIAANYILMAVRQIAVQAMNILMDRELPEEDRARIAYLATDHEEVMGLHDLRTRSAGATHFIQFHIELDPALSLSEAHTISEDVERQVKVHYPNAQVLIHADPYGHHEPRDRF